MKRNAAVYSWIVLLFATSSSQAAIVNFDSRSSTPTELFLGPGTYLVTPIGISDGGQYNAWSAWSFTSCSNIDGCPRTRPTTNTGWITDYYVESMAIVSAVVDGLELTPVDTDPVPRFVDYWLSTPGKTYYHVADNVVYPDPLTALDHAKSSVFTLSDAGPVKFYATVEAFGDNRGGMSLLVGEAEPAMIPAPGAVVLAGLGTVAFGWLRRRRIV